MSDPEAFVVKHYNEDERPIIKGNGFDGLEIGYDRQEAEEFVQWVNLQLKEVERLREVAGQALAFTLRGFSTVRDFDAARAVMHDALRAALKETK